MDASVLTRRPGAGARPQESRRGWPLAAAIGLWALAIVAAHLWGRHLADQGRQILLGTPPLHARFDPRLSLGVIPALAVGAAALVLGPRIAERTSWRCLLLYATLGGLLWAEALALADGAGSLAAPLLSRHDYLHSLSLIGSPGDYLAGFTDDIARYATHVRSHPPGMMLLLWGLDRLGMADAGVLAGIVIAAGASASAAALLAVREVAGEARARATAPFLALAPAAVWVATSADALFLGVGAWAVALLVLATGRRGRRGDSLAVAGGLAFGVALFLSYGALLLGAVPATVAAARRRVRPLALAASGIAAVGLALAAAGFSWIEGLQVAREQYALGVARTRPYGYFLLANLAAFAIALGPAAAAALASLRDRRVWLLAGGALIAVAVADLSGLSKGEVERIWLPFVPWVLAAAAGLPARRAWLAVQVGAGLLVQVLVVPPW